MATDQMAIPRGSGNASPAGLGISNWWSWLALVIDGRGIKWQAGQEKERYPHGSCTVGLFLSYCSPAAYLACVVYRGTCGKMSEIPYIAACSHTIKLSKETVCLTHPTLFGLCYNRQQC